MIGLEYILALYNKPHTELAEELGIARQNINLWIKGKGKIPKKYTPILSKKFNIPEEYFQRELDEVDKLTIQKEKLKKEINPLIIDDGLNFSIEKEDFDDETYYMNNEIKEIDTQIEKTKIITDMKKLLDSCNLEFELDIYKMLVKLLKSNDVDKYIVEYLIEALCHYYNLLPDWVLVSNPEGNEFVQKLIKVINEYDNGEN